MRVKKLGRDITQTRVEEAKNARKILEDICFSISKTIKILKGRIIKNQGNEFYRRLEEAVMDATEKSGIKKDFSYRYRENLKNKYEDIHTDEKLVATSFYLSALRRKTNAIITRDSDIPKIMDISQSVLESTKYFNGIVDALQKHPAKIYFIEKSERVKLAADTSDRNVFLNAMASSKK